MRITKSNQEKNKKENYKKILKRVKKEVKGITLIALVVTIIVLLILAGVALNLTIGQNGIFSRAQNAVETYDEASDIEKINLAIAAAQIANNGSTAIKEDIEIVLLEDGIKSIVVDNEDGTRNIIFINSKKIYKVNTDGSIEDTNSDFDSIYAAPNSQDEARNEGVIGIGTDGQPVDMDLWEYTLLEDRTYILNDNETAENSGYLGSFSDNGEIIGTIPQYISIDKGENYVEVTNLYNVFRDLSSLKVAPVIPSTVTNMVLAFSHTQIETAPVLPKNLKILSWAFEFTKLTEAPSIPNGVQRMYGTFYMCKELVKPSVLPNSVTIIDYLFAGCENLILNDFIIGENVESMEHLFEDCYSLKGSLIINANPTGYYYCFYRCSINSSDYLILSGKSNILLEIFNTKIESSKIIMK